MLAEHPSATTKRFINSWRNSNTDSSRLAEELISVSDETNRRLNKFHFVVRDGELIDPATGNIINFKRNSDIEIKEGKVWDSLKSWANNNDAGSSTWTSPQLEGIYPCDKVIYYEIAYTDEFPPQKIILSTAILIDSKEGIFSEDLRDKLIINPVDFTLTALLEELGQTHQGQKQTASQEKINYFVNQIKSGFDTNSIIEEMQKSGILGDYSLSCERSSSFALSYGARVLDFRGKENWEWHKGDCVIPAPECGKKNVEVGPCNVCRKCQAKFDEA
ncbi:hypothetical protein BH10PAT1_BH10PAT1_5620 [soil metagenome]